MKTAVAQTSIAAYDDLKAENFKGQHGAILSAMVSGCIYTRRQLARTLGLETSSMAGRINELVAAGQVVVCGKVRCPITQKNVEAIKLAARQMELA